MRSRSAVISPKKGSHCHLLRFFLLPFLLLLTFPIAARSQTTTGTTVDGLNYTAANNQITITGYSGNGGAVSIPSMINGLPVTNIGNNAFFNRDSVTSITISEGVTSIGNSAFAFSDFLTSVTIPRSVTTIGDNAFAPCSSLSSILIPEGVTSIGNNAFAWCPWLIDITIPRSVINIGNNAFYYCQRLSRVLFKGNAPLMGEGVFDLASSGFVVCFCYNGTGFDSPNWNGYPTATMSSSLAYTAANGQVSIMGYFGSGGAVIIPDTIDNLPVTSIGNRAFQYCSNLISVAIPNSVTHIGDSAFFSCWDLANVAIPSSITSIGSSAFQWCSSLTSVTIPSSVTSIESYAFSYCTSLTSVTIPSGVTTIGSNAFYYCTNLKSVTIPGSVTSIASGAFSYCYSLTSGIFMGNAPAMEDRVFFDIPYEFTVYYYDGSVGFTSPTWWPSRFSNGCHAVNMGASSPVKPWLLSKGLSHDADLQSSPSGDGVSLLMSYALNLDPTQNQSGSVPRPLVAGNQMSLTFYAGNADVTYSVESSTDLKTWSTEGVAVSPLDSNSFCTATVPSTDSRRFMRLVVSY